MEALIQHYIRQIEAVPMRHNRYLHKEIDWSERLIGITGPRGTGKTTLLLQHIKSNFIDRNQALYASLDNIWFTRNSLMDLVTKFHAYGGTHLFLDEVHRYPDWSIEIKNIYDSFPSLHIVFTGSSMLEIYTSHADLSRRAIHYYLHGLSFREYLRFEKDLDLPAVSLDNILKNHLNIATEITAQIKVLPLFDAYLQHGYYPFYKEGVKNYPMKVQNIINTILDSDLPSVEKIEYASILKIKRLLMILSSLVPFTPSMVTLSSEIETNRATAVRYLGILERAALIKMLLPQAKGMSLMSKPEKIYLDNPNLLHALAAATVNNGNKRETFFANQVGAIHTLNSTKRGDFVVNGKYTIEIGGKGKGFNQIKDIPDSFVASDEIEIGFGNKIPLWLFGMMY